MSESLTAKIELTSPGLPKRNPADLKARLTLEEMDEAGKGPLACIPLQFQ